jgi:hypothetical protein
MVVSICANYLPIGINLCQKGLFLTNHLSFVPVSKCINSIQNYSSKILPENRYIKYSLVAAITVVALASLYYFGLSYFIGHNAYNFLIGVHQPVALIKNLSIDCVFNEFIPWLEFAVQANNFSYMTFGVAKDLLISLRENKNKPKTTLQKVKSMVKCIISIGLLVLFIDSFIRNVIKARNFLKFVSTGINSQGFNEKNLPVALVLRAKDDHNGVLSLAENVGFFSNIESNFFLRTKKVGNLEEMKTAMDALSQSFGKIKLLIIDAHGAPDLMCLSESENGYIENITNVASDYFSGIADDATVILNSCAVGGKDTKGNMVDWFAKQMPNRPVFGPICSITNESLKFNSFLPVKVQFFVGVSFRYIQIFFKLCGFSRLKPLFYYFYNVTYLKKIVPGAT